jgi:beta-hydroxylase
MSVLLAPKFLVLYVFAASALYVHLRGRVRFPFLRQLFNHSTLLSPYNALIYLFSAVPARPLLEPSHFPGLDVLADNWEVIRDEAIGLSATGKICGPVRNNDVGFNSFFKRGWKRFYLRWYDRPLPSAEALCPRTVALLARVPNVRGAMFASLAPGSRLNPHRDPFAGSLRYHLGLVTANSPDCYISVDGERYHWRDGHAVVFDETNIHYVENNTSVNRIILLCDVERPLRTRAMRAVNRWVTQHIIKASATQNTHGEPVGLLNQFYGCVYHPAASRINAAGRALKSSNRTLYYATKYTLILAVLWLVLR